MVDMFEDLQWNWWLNWKQMESIEQKSAPWESEQPVLRTTDVALTVCLLPATALSVALVNNGQATEPIEPLHALNGVRSSATCQELVARPQATKGIGDDASNRACAIAAVTFTAGGWLHATCDRACPSAAQRSRNPLLPTQALSKS